MAREVVEMPTAIKLAPHPVGTGPFRSCRVAYVHLASCWSAIQLIAKSLYDAEPNPDDVEGQALAAEIQGSQAADDRYGSKSRSSKKFSRAGFSFLDKQQDLIYPLPFDFVNIAVPNGKLAPFLLEARRLIVSDTEFGRLNAYLLQHGEPGRRRLFAG